jgi:hypothetical protein
MNTITADDWRRMFAAHRAQGHYEGSALLRRLRAAVAGKKTISSDAHSPTPSSLRTSESYADAKDGMAGAAPFSTGAGSLAGERSAGDGRSDDDVTGFAEYAEAGAGAIFPIGSHPFNKANEHASVACENDGVSSAVSSATAGRDRQDFATSRGGNKSRGGAGVGCGGTQSLASAAAGPLSTS